MRKSIGIAASFAALALIASPAMTASPSVDKSLAAAVAAPTRTPANVARDKYRNPAQTLSFFGIKPTDTVVELWPGGGWYTEILAPYLAPKGKLIVAVPGARGEESVGKRLDGNASVYGKVGRATFPSTAPGATWPVVAPGTADAVLTFRNVHNWKMGSGSADKADYSEAAFREIYAMLKPGGVLGIEDHRLPESGDAARERSSGYLKVSTVRALAEKAGFQFAGASEVNANPKDPANWPKGVWTLPPNFAEGDVDRAKYAAIGESDRMTLRFIKPKK